MTHVEKDRRIDLLLNTLEAERYVRCSLLSEIIDELTELPSAEEARTEATTLLGRLRRGPVDEGAFLAAIASVRALVRARVEAA